MTGRDVVEEVAARRSPERPFIKWWCRERDFVDYDLVDAFLGRVRADETIDGYELLDLEQMWQLLTDLDPDNLTRGVENGREVIRWVWADSKGGEKVSVFPFTPEGILTIFNDELFS